MRDENFWYTVNGNAKLTPFGENLTYLENCILMYLTFENPNHWESVRKYTGKFEKRTMTKIIHYRIYRNFTSLKPTHTNW